MRYTPGPGKSDRSYVSAAFSSYLGEQMALLGSQDKIPRPPSAFSLMTPWRDHSVYWETSCSAVHGFYWANTFRHSHPICLRLMNHLCILSIHTLKNSPFCIYIHQRVCTFESVSIFQLADHVWRQVSSHGNKKKQGFVPVFPFNLPFSQGLRQENMFFHESQQDCAL